MGQRIRSVSFWSHGVWIAGRKLVLLRWPSHFGNKAEWTFGRSTIYKICNDRMCALFHSVLSLARANHCTLVCFAIRWESISVKNVCTQIFIPFATCTEIDGGWVHRIMLVCMSNCPCLIYVQGCLKLRLFLVNKQHLIPPCVHWLSSTSEGFGEIRLRLYSFDYFAKALGEIEEARVIRTKITGIV